MIQLLPGILIRSLLLTMIIELCGGLLSGVRSGRDLIIIMLSQIVTNPAVVSISFTVNLLRGPAARAVSLAFLEPAAIVTEGLLYQRNMIYKNINPFLLSLILNALSFCSGEIINFYL